MTHPPHVDVRVTRVTLPALLVMLTVLSVAVAAAAAQARPGQDAPAAPGVNVDAAAMAEFQKRLQAYLELRESLANKIRPLSPTADSAELTTRQGALAAAMKTARAKAKPGDLIPPGVAKQIAEIVRADFLNRRKGATTAALSEVPQTRPVINKSYPPGEALPTVPPLLLGNLPKLPDNLQYRYYGRHLVILDGDLQIMTDYVADVLPAH